jgi:hypothetical protein
VVDVLAPIRSWLDVDRYVQRLGVASVRAIGTLFHVAERKQVDVQRIGKHFLGLFRGAPRRDHAGELVDARLHPAVLDWLQACRECKGLHHVTEIKAARYDGLQGIAQTFHAELDTHGQYGLAT